MEPTTRSTRDRADDIDNMLDEALQETSPASDPVACTRTPSIRPAEPLRRAGQAGHAAKALAAPPGPARRRSRNGHPSAHAGSGQALGVWAAPVVRAVLEPNLIRGSRIMKLTPLHDRVVVKRIEQERTTAAGIVIPDTVGEKPDQGEVLAVGPGKRLEGGPRGVPDVKVGDRVLFGKYAGTTVKVEGEELLVMREDDLLGVVTAGAAQ